MSDRVELSSTNMRVDGYMLPIKPIAAAGRDACVLAAGIAVLNHYRIGGVTQKSSPRCAAWHGPRSAACASTNWRVASSSLVCARRSAPGGSRTSSSHCGTGTRSSPRRWSTCSASSAMPSSSPALSAGQRAKRRWWSATTISRPRCWSMSRYCAAARAGCSFVRGERYEASSKSRAAGAWPTLQVVVVDPISGSYAPQ